MTLAVDQGQPALQTRKDLKLGHVLPSLIAIDLLVLEKKKSFSTSDYVKSVYPNMLKMKTNLGSASYLD